MDKILLALGALTLGIGILFLPRSARADDTRRGNVEVILLEDDIVEQGSSPLGLRNNNPFNLEFRNIGWIGETGTDGRFSVFDTAENGIRAGMINIHTKMTRDGATTVRKLLTRLSPAFENPLESFINFTAGRLNVAPDQQLVFGVHIIALSQAIIQFENGQQPFTFEELESALQRTGRL